MNVVQLDAAIRIGAVTTILLLAWLLLHHRRQTGLPALLFAPLAICLSGFVINNTPVALLRPTALPGTVAHLVSGYAVIFLWWFCLAFFDRSFRLRGSVLGVGLIWAAIAAVDRGLLGARFADEGLSRLLVTMGFGIVAHLVWRLTSERTGDLIQPRHDARILVALFLGGMLFIDLAADAIFGFAWRPMAFAMAQNIMILAFCFWLAGRLLTVRPDMIGFGVAGEVAVVETRPRPTSWRDDALYRRLTALMDTQHIYLDPDLTFAAFVKRLGAPERAVRQLVNRELGYDHFRTFLNHHRVAEARRLLRDPRRVNEKLIPIALDSGFASLASFNRAFRAIEGCSPSHYRAMAHAPAHLPPQPAFEERKAMF